MAVRRPSLLVAALALAALAAPPPAGREHAFDVTSNKPFIQVRINGSAPQTFILDTGCSGGSVIARECARRLGLRESDAVRQNIGAGAGVSVGVATTPDVTLDWDGDTLGVPALRVFSLAHVAPYEGRPLDGLLGEDFLRRHVVSIDYARRRAQVLDPRRYAPPRGAIVVPIALDNGLAVARGAITPAEGAPIPCRLVIDTGVRATVILYHPFVLAHHFLESKSPRLSAVVGGGAGGQTLGDIARLGELRIGALAFASPTAIFSRDTSGVFAGLDADGIVGGELLRRCRVTFDYPHARLVLEPQPGLSQPFEYDMSGTFLVSDGTDFGRILITSVAARTPAAEAGLKKGDEILAIDDRRASALGLEAARALFRQPARYRLQIRRGGTSLTIELTTRPLV